MTPDFTKRSQGIEIMDDLECSGEVVRQTLRELETINRLLGGNYVTLNGIRKLMPENCSDPIRLADLGCGSGDILRLIRKWGQREKYALELTGYDANPFIIAHAADHTPPEYHIGYKAINIFSKQFENEKFDIVTGTLFFHHFSEDQLIAFFGKLKAQTRLGFVINDIHRHWLAFYSIRGLTWLLSKSAMVKFDAPLSVLRAFRKKELNDIMERAGITNYKIRWMWAFRWQIVVKTA